MIILITILLFLIALYIYFAHWLVFKRKRDYIILEINRSPNIERETLYRQKLKELYLESIPLIGWIFKK